LILAASVVGGAAVVLRAEPDALSPPGPAGPLLFRKVIAVDPGAILAAGFRIERLVGVTRL
jgi:hypothetical protein